MLMTVSKVIVDTSDIDAFIKKLDIFQKQQVPYATAMALTWTAKSVQKKIRKKIGSVFTIRKQSFPKSIKIIPAKKNSLVSEVYTKAPFASLQEEGGYKKPKHKHIAAPVYDSINSLKRRTKTNRPAYVLLSVKKKAFIIKTKHGQEIIVKRETKRKKPLKFIYSLKSKARIKRKK